MARMIFFLLIQTLPTFWAERIGNSRTFIVLIFWTPNFWMSRSPDLQISEFPGPQISKFPDLQVPKFPDAQTPPAPPDELSDPNLTPLPTHPAIKYGARALAAIKFLMGNRSPVVVEIIVKSCQQAQFMIRAKFT